MTLKYQACDSVHIVTCGFIVFNFKSQLKKDEKTRTEIKVMPIILFDRYVYF